MMAGPHAVAPPARGTRRRILVIEDDPGIRTMLGSILRHSGYETECTSTGQEALVSVDEFRPDLMVVDVMLPDIDGLEIARVLRTLGVAIPIVFLTARTDEEDVVAGLRSGGDDYVTKPFNVDELLLRIRAILGRLHPGDPIGEDDQADMLGFADLFLDRRTGEVRRAGRIVSLTPTEFKLLAFLMTHPKQAVSKRVIVETVWGGEFAGGIRIVDTYMKSLRRKVDCFFPPLLHSVRGVGYCLRLPPAEDAPGSPG
ncbi:response regulator transcription factor [Actinoplanes subtropicus]|uniref:response regulator transcription factor n=1 Tax=Actinoplanes subtropicus TaxID=543632 RepID=UPI000A462681|nr:response regulator transcription factor [Actinoplanes subtropicus]